MSHWIFKSMSGTIKDLKKDYGNRIKSIVKVDEAFEFGEYCVKETDSENCAADTLHQFHFMFSKNLLSPNFNVFKFCIPFLSLTNSICQIQVKM